MKKTLLMIMMLCISFGATACKSGTSDQPETSEQTQEAETSEQAEENETPEPLHAAESLEIEIDENSEGVIGAD